MSRSSPRTSKFIVILTNRPSHIVITAFVVACVSGTAEFSILTFLAHLNVSRLSLRFQNSITTGVVSGALVWTLLVMVSLRRQYLRSKLGVIADLNHELRNALEVIMQSGYLPGDQRQAALHDSAERLNRVLGEILEEIHATLPIGLR